MSSLIKMCDYFIFLAYYLSVITYIFEKAKYDL